ncbi:flagellar brake protein [Sporomusa sp.]|uniref:flagellar brake protein n=1 Tax=Sporomusa sp. TaxID=2078658 RepID=UPI002C2512C0|nr:flagellar brake domain-containing protein [Sporomusa sp.]HWR43147.1 flagellar brake domain-containing protein [Sporomusa sp.]
MSIKFEEIFKINQRIEVFVPSRSGLVEQYRSRIEDINADNMVIAMPMTKGLPVMLQRGEVFFGRVVSNFSAFEFTSSLIAKQLQPLPVWIIAAPYNLKKIQQRAFVRVDAALPVQITEIVDGKVVEDTIVNAVTKDISGGGLQIATTRLWQIDTELMVTVNYPDIGPLTLRSKVMRIQQPQPDRTVFWVGIKFLEISERDRGNIIKFIFKKQLEQRRKGLE